MIHEIFPVGPLQCNCSVIGDEQTREALVIDPGDDIEDVMAIVQRHGLTVKQIVITHAHIDHIGGAAKLKRLTGAPILLNQNDNTLLKMLSVQAVWTGMRPPEKVAIDASLSAGDKVRTGSLVADVLHTPGHTEGSICLYFAPEKKLIAGDTLFAGGCGRLFANKIMLTLSLIGIGCGDPAYLTRKAVSTINAADLILIPRKGEEKKENSA